LCRRFRAHPCAVAFEGHRNITLASSRALTDAEAPASADVAGPPTPASGPAPSVAADGDARRRPPAGWHLMPLDGWDMRERSASGRLFSIDGERPG
jgi:hypothetical protein